MRVALNRACLAQPKLYSNLQVPGEVLQRPNRALLLQVELVSEEGWRPHRQNKAAGCLRVMCYLGANSCWCLAHYGSGARPL